MWRKENKRTPVQQKPNSTVLLLHINPYKKKMKKQKELKLFKVFIVGNYIPAGQIVRVKPIRSFLNSKNHPLPIPEENASEALNLDINRCHKSSLRHYKQFHSRYGRKSLFNKSWHDMQMALWKFPHKGVSLQQTDYCYTCKDINWQIKDAEEEECVMMSQASSYYQTRQFN